MDRARVIALALALIAAIAVPLCASSGWARGLGVLGLMGGGGGAVDPYTSVFSDDFNRSDSTTVGGSWTSETDTDSLLSILSGKLVWSTATPKTAGYVSKTFATNCYKWKASFTISIDTTTVSSTNKVYRILTVSNSAGIVFMIELKSVGTATINTLYVQQRLEDWSYNTSDVSYAITGGSTYTVEITGTTATTGSALDGSIDVKINGSSVTGYPKTGLDTYARHADRVLFGVPYLTETSLDKVITLDDFNFYEAD